MIFLLEEKYEPFFPDPKLADPEGLLAIGGKITPDWLLKAYETGVFPWFEDDNQILWWSPDPRAIMTPSQIKIQKSMRPYFNQKKFTLTIDTVFEQVIDNCRQLRLNKNEGTWITSNMLENYVKLHELGYAHSFEVWKNSKLVGGLYGVSLGKMFFGESMFSKVSNASKFAFIYLAKILQKLEFILIDCQLPNKYLVSMGCGVIPRSEYLYLLQKNKNFPTLKGKWTNIVDLSEISFKF